MSSYREGDTICAESTPRGRGGISVVRLSGADSARIVALLFDKPLPDHGRFRAGRIVIPGPEPVPLDDAVVSVYSKPHSYTGEDVVEISTHGNPVIVSELLEALYARGARPSESGEFTLRAYLNGRIDLTQAEAVSDLINAVSKEAAQAALKQLDGNIGKACEEIAALVERLLIYTELELDFSEEDVELVSQEEKLVLVRKAIKAAEGMLAGYQSSRRLREGVKVVLTGAPNVGKSSIYNVLIDEEKAIVHKSPGTTRDVLSSKTIIGGIEFEFFDTAGLRDAPDEIEDEGISRAMRALKQADIVLEIDSIDLAGFSESTYDVPTIKVTNKCDNGMPEHVEGVSVSARTRYGIEELRYMLLDLVTDDKKTGDGTINRERHYTLLTSGLASLQRGLEGLMDRIPAEMIAEEWRSALAALDELSGKKKLDDILNTIFGKFCIGK